MSEIERRKFVGVAGLAAVAVVVGHTGPRMRTLRWRILDAGAVVESGECRVPEADGVREFTTRSEWCQARLKPGRSMFIELETAVGRLIGRCPV